MSELVLRRSKAGPCAKCGGDIADRCVRWSLLGSRVSFNRCRNCGNEWGERKVNRHNLTKQETACLNYWGVSGTVQDVND